ncbi:MAG TPA: hypothetical protein VFG49_14275 [Dyella sp.]|uniref:hypothetical protein n=1 Tax=Dyella sp. TaxID=1869338 RepID=UPI002D79B96D|nr:hypothetical protein [Dyella sp.]HET6554690.1 hypothetical protein [Dyella sp.]
MAELAAWKELFSAAEADRAPSLPTAAAPANTAPAADPTFMKPRLEMSFMLFPFDFACTYCN